jgi:5-methylcytosine-specific restriction endonuclease McrA
MAIRKQFFSRHPLCEACKREGVVKEATFLDHIVPLYAGGKNEWSNYQGLCKAHSFAKTGRENSARLKGQPAPVEPEPDREPWQPVIA